MSESEITYIGCVVQAGPGPRHPDCRICLLTIGQDEETVLHIACQNAWHKECLDQWVQNVRRTPGARATCPICRDSPITPANAPRRQPNENSRDAEIRDLILSYRTGALVLERHLQGRDARARAESPRVLVCRDMDDLEARVGSAAAMENPLGDWVPQTDRPSAVSNLDDENLRLVEDLDAAGLRWWRRFRFPNTEGDYYVPGVVITGEERESRAMHEQHLFEIRIALDAKELFHAWGAANFEIKAVLNGNDEWLNNPREASGGPVPGSGTWRQGDFEKFEHRRDEGGHMHFACYLLEGTRIVYCVPIPPEMSRSIRVQIEEMLDSDDNSSDDSP